jgi:hypothetical protein
MQGPDRSRNVMARLVQAIWCCTVLAQMARTKPAPAKAGAGP